MKTHPHHHSKPAAPLPLPVYFHRQPSGYADKARGLAWVVGALSLLYCVVSQHERIDDLERQLSVQRQAQRELAKQTQQYKRRMAAAARDQQAENIAVAGRLQTHVALLRHQIACLRHEPVSAAQAAQTFRDEVNLAGQHVWVNSDSKLKPHFPALGEYRQK